MSIETDAQSYTGSPPTPAPRLQEFLEQRERDAAARVKAYRQALDHAARQGKLTEEYARELAAKPHLLGAASDSWAAQALAVFAKHLHSARKAAQSWKIGHLTSEMIVLERLADDAAAKVQVDLIYLGELGTDLPGPGVAGARPNRKRHMIFIRVPADFRPQVHPRLFPIDGVGPDGEPHPLTYHACAACSELMAAGPVVLVPVGITPESRKEAGWTNAACVAVHLVCSGYSEADLERLAQEQERS